MTGTGLNKVCRKLSRVVAAATVLREQGGKGRQMPLSQPLHRQAVPACLFNFHVEFGAAKMERGKETSKED